MILESLHQNDDQFESVEPMSDRPQWREWAKEEITRHYSVIGGTLVGERFWHRAWPPDVTLAFLNAPVIRPAKGEIQRKLYGNSRGLRLGG